jgi:predicted ATPase
LFVLKVINLSLKYGNTPLSAFAYACYGLVLCGILGNIEEGYDFGKLALQLLSRFNAKELEAKVYVVGPVLPLYMQPQPLPCRLSQPRQ